MEFNVVRSQCLTTPPPSLGVRRGVGMTQLSMGSLDDPASQFSPLPSPFSTNESVVVVLDRHVQEQTQAVVDQIASERYRVQQGGNGTAQFAAAHGAQLSPTAASARAAIALLAGDAANSVRQVWRQEISARLDGTHHPLSPSSIFRAETPVSTARAAKSRLASTVATAAVPPALRAPAPSAVRERRHSGPSPPQVIRAAEVEAVLPPRGKVRRASALACTEIVHDPTEDGLPMWTDEVVVQSSISLGRLSGLVGNYVADADAAAGGAALRYTRTAGGNECYVIVRSLRSRKWKIQWVHNNLPTDREKTIYVSIEVDAPSPVGLAFRRQGTRRTASLCVRGFEERLARGMLWTIGSDRGARPYRNPAAREKGLVVATASSVAQRMRVADMVGGRAATVYTRYEAGLGCVALDLGESRCVQVAAYSLRHGFSTGHARAVHWVLEGQRKTGSGWVLLHSHTAADPVQLPNAGYSTATWAVTNSNARGAFSSPRHWMRSVRVRLMGPNMNGRESLALCGLELFGSLRDDRVAGLARSAQAQEGWSARTLVDAQGSVYARNGPAFDSPARAPPTAPAPALARESTEGPASPHWRPPIASGEGVSSSAFSFESAVTMRQPASRGKERRGSMTEVVARLGGRRVSINNPLDCLS